MSLVGCAREPRPYGRVWRINMLYISPPSLFGGVDPQHRQSPAWPFPVPVPAAQRRQVDQPALGGIVSISSELEWRLAAAKGGEMTPAEVYEQRIGCA
jgi:hypothetical protein